MRWLMDTARRLYTDEEGATMVEYALLVALIAVALIATVQGLSTKIGGTYTKASTAMPQ